MSQGTGEARCRVLVVDDDALLLQATARVLAAWFEVVTAADAAAALDVLGGQRVDAVLADYEMPGGNGLALLDAVRSRHPAVRRVLTSGALVPGISDHVASGRIAAFVPKPASPTEIARALGA